MSAPTVQCVTEGNDLPRQMTVGAAGLDLPARRVDKVGGEKAVEPWLEIGNPIGLMPYERARIGTGTYVAIPEGYEGQIRPRSGLADDHGLTVLNTPGTIDADYRGEIKVILINLGHEEVVIEPDDRIAQLVIAPVAAMAWDVVEELPGTERGDGGFGSTGT